MLVFSTLMAGPSGRRAAAVVCARAGPVGRAAARQGASYAAFLFGDAASVSYYPMRNPHGVFEYELLAPARARLIIGALFIVERGAGGPGRQRTGGDAP